MPAPESAENSRPCASKAFWLEASNNCASFPMFDTFSETTQNTPWAVVVMGSVPSVFWEQSTPLTVNSNLPSRTAWFRPTALAESPEGEPPSTEDDEPSTAEDGVEPVL